MNNKFDELTKGMAQSVTRRGALKKFSVGLAGMALAAFGLANTAEAALTACEKCNRSCLRKNKTWTVDQCRAYCIGYCWL